MMIRVVEAYRAMGYPVGESHSDQIGNAEIKFDGHIPLRTGNSMF